MARASVQALAQLQVPRARVRRAGLVEEVESPGLVPGDVLLLEAGHLVPADGRIVSSSTSGRVTAVGWQPFGRGRWLLSHRPPGRRRLDA
jgi:magnesium-transporting ATPase (P-type)